MKVRVQLFARARDVAGASELLITVPAGATVADLRIALVAAAPGLAPLRSHLHVAIGVEYASDSDPIPPGAEVSCFPTVSGG